jgi:two-component system, OmpR family, response regulator
MSRSPLQRVLFVEDDADIRTIAVLALETLGGFTLAACASGAEALERAQQFAPQLLLLDVMMPGMDGPTTLERLRTLPGLAQVPVIFMTAKVQASEVAHYKALGAIGVITKPFDPMGLAVQVQELWQSATGPSS